MILTAPAGFEFNTTTNVSATVVDQGACSGGGNGPILLGIGPGFSTQSVSPTTTTITITVFKASKGVAGCQGTLTFSGINVRPTAISPLANGNVTISGTSVISGVASGSSVGTLTEIASPDTTPPVITILGNDPETVEVGSSYVDAGATATDNVDGDLTANITVTNNVNTNVTTRYNVTYSVTDSSGNTATLTRFVDVVDTTPPVITLNGTDPVSVIVNTSYTDAGATATDNYDGNISANIIMDTSAVDITTLGSYLVTFDVNDSSNNSATQVTRTVNVLAAPDTTPPVITILGNNPETVEAGTNYSDAGATAQDDVDGDITASIIVNDTVDANTIGTYTVMFDVNDSSGNPAQQVNRTVNVVDTTPPVITLNGVDPVTIEVGTPYNDDGANASDNYDGDLTGSITVSNPVDTSTLGTYTVTYDVADSSGNNATQVTRTVNVVDTTVPLITLNGVDPVTLEVGTPYIDDGANASDNYDGDLTPNIVTVNPVDTNTVGTYQVTYDVNDSSNNSATQVTRTVNVVDTTAPVIVLNGNDPVTIEVGSVYSDDGANASDNYDGDLTANISTVNPVDTNTVGQYTITYDVTDANGNTATQATRTVNVVDTTAPVITLNGNDPETVEGGSVYSDTGANASDNYDGDLTSSIVTVNPVDTNTLGTYTVTYDVNDSNGNAATQVTRNVTVVDTTAPTLNGTPSDMTVEATSGSGAAVVFTDPTATDAVDSAPVVGCTPASGSTFALGTTLVNCTATDASGNSASETFNVTVQDTTAPFIFLTGSANVTIEAGAVYSDAGATAVDNVNGNLTANITTVNPVNTAVIGTYTVTYDVNDTAGNAATQVTRTVNVVDTTAPVITVLGSNPVFVTQGNPYADAGATASDNLDGNLTANITVTNPVNTSAIGSYNVTYQVTDSLGNNATATRTVNVIAPAPSGGGGGGGGGGGSSFIRRPLTPPTPTTTPPVVSPPAAPPKAPVPAPTGNAQTPPVAGPPQIVPPPNPPAANPILPQATGLFTLGGHPVTKTQAGLGLIILALLGAGALYAFRKR